jgi:hypothetical protein
LRNSDQSNSSQRRGQKSRKPSSKNGQRGGNGQKTSASSGSRNGQQRSGTGQRSGQGSSTGQRNTSSTGQRNTSSRGKSRNEISQAWASDTSTLSSHMPTAKKNEWGKKKNDSKTSNGAGSRSRGKNQSSGSKNRSGKFDRNQTQNKPHARSSNGSPVKQQTSTNKETTSREGSSRVGNIDPFELFCSYHLGITQDKGYRTANINEVAKRFRSEPGMIKQALKEYDMDPESLLDRDFDIGLAQLDIQVAPEGVDRLELARGIYQDFQDAPRVKRDWNKILEEDRKENQKTFRN